MKTVTYEPKAGDHLECENGSLCCWQPWDGVESLEENGERHALTVLSKPPLNEKLIEVHPTLEKMSRVLWETDPEVVAFLDQAAEYPGSWDEAWQRRVERARDIAWRRREPKGSWRRAVERASAVLGRLTSPLASEVPK